VSVCCERESVCLLCLIEFLFCVCVCCAWVSVCVVRGERVRVCSVSEYVCESVNVRCLTVCVFVRVKGWDG